LQALQQRFQGFACGRAVGQAGAVGIQPAIQAQGMLALCLDALDNLLGQCRQLLAVLHIAVMEQAGLTMQVGRALLGQRFQGGLQTGQLFPTQSAVALFLANDDWCRHGRQALRKVHFGQLLGWAGGIVLTVQRGAQGLFVLSQVDVQLVGVAAQT